MKKEATSGALILALVLAIAAISFAQSAPPAQTPAEPPAAPQKTGSIEVSVTFPGGKPLKDTMIYADDQQIKITSPGAPVKIDNIPVGRLAVTVEGEAAQGLVRGQKRYLGVSEVTVRENAVETVTVSVRKVDNIEEFCLGCHPNPRDPKVKVLPGQIPRDIHASGKEFPEKTRTKYMAELKIYNDYVAKLEKEGKPHGLPIPLEERLVKVGKKEVKKLYYTCESCHTLHQRTAWKYARSPFRNDPGLCVGCHF